MSRRPVAVQKITGARRSLTEDIKGRQTRYLMSMAVRTACFLGAIFASGWLRGILFAGALILPYLAVVIANGGREPAVEAPRMAGGTLPALGAPTQRPAAPAEGTGSRPHERSA